MGYCDKNVIADILTVTVLKSSLPVKCPSVHVARADTICQPPHLSLTLACEGVTGPWQAGVTAVTAVTGRGR